MQVQAFQPASHYALIHEVTEDMPSDSIIKEALQKYPDIAAWGSMGPDLGYLELSALAGYAPWADRFHYYKIGSFTSEQMKEALESGNLEEIAFAAGWVSHVSGDLACHGIYVNPECGVYLEREDTRKLHKSLEVNAEPYVWCNLAGLSESEYKENLVSKFSNKDSIPYDFMNRISQKIYQEVPSSCGEKQWGTLLRTGLITGIGYTYTDYDTASDFLDENGRKGRLTNAFLTAKKHCVTLLEQAESGDYSGFSDHWNLDVGESDAPIGSLTITMKTGTKACAGTDDDIYFGIELDSGVTKEWKLDKESYNDFENGDTEEYYLYLDDTSASTSSIKKVWISKKHIRFSVGQSWYFDSFEVDVNGNTVISNSVKQWLDGDSTVSFDGNWVIE